MLWSLWVACLYDLDHVNPWQHRPGRVASRLRETHRAGRGPSSPTLAHDKPQPSRLQFEVKLPPDAIDSVDEPGGTVDQEKVSETVKVHLCAFRLVEGSFTDSPHRKQNSHHWQIQTSLFPLRHFRHRHLIPPQKKFRERSRCQST
jgi:hypothetical protein